MRLGSGGSAAHKKVAVVLLIDIILMETIIKGIAKNVVEEIRLRVAATAALLPLLLLKILSP